MADPVLRLDGVSKKYKGPDGELSVLSDISMSVEKGEFVALHGSSGCGKSTLLLSAGGLLAPDNGKVTVDGQDFYALPSEKRAGYRAEHVGFVFQQFHLIPYLSVLDNVLAASLAVRREDNGFEKRALELLEKFNLSDRARHVPSELSTGERQRTALARALLNGAGLILADEPTGNLDGDNAGGVLGHLKSFAEGGGAVLLVTHDARVADYAQRTLVLQNGALVVG